MVGPYEEEEEGSVLYFEKEWSGEYMLVHWEYPRDDTGANITFFLKKDNTGEQIKTILGLESIQIWKEHPEDARQLDAQIEAFNFDDLEFDVVCSIVRARRGKKMEVQSLLSNN